MKTFLQFITENTATQQATRLGLEGDGHGGWYKDGEFVAKTVLDCAMRILVCPIPPSSMVSIEHGYGVGIGHNALPHGHI